MWITEYDFERITPPDLRSKFHTGKVLYRLMKHYCRPLTARGLCPKARGGNCISCKEFISRALQNTSNSINRDIIKDPYAIMVWHIRTIRSEILEAKEENRAKTPRNVLGEPLYNRNPFQEYIKEIK